jgi:hypothetical protein
MNKGYPDAYSDEETAKRRDEALRRALNTPPKPHKSGKKKPTHKRKKRKL